jgi:hypothetical protein
MTDNDLDLGSLTLEKARSLVGQDFFRPCAEGPDLILRLTVAEPTRRDPTVDSSDFGRPFSLLFLGPTDPRLSQGMHDLEHPCHPLRGIFLVPAGQDNEGINYEAIFS